MSSLTFKTNLPTIFSSEADIRAKIVGSRDVYPTLTSWDSFNRLVDSWKFSTTESTNFISVVKEILSKNTSLDVHDISEDNELVILSDMVAIEDNDCWAKYYPQDIRPFLEPLLKVNHVLKEKHIDLICKAWPLLLLDPASKDWIIHIFFTEKMPEWIYASEPKECPINTIMPILKQWIDDRIETNDVNFRSMFQIFNLFLLYGASYFPVLSLIQEEHKTHLRCLASEENTLQDLIKELKTAIKYQYQIDYGRKLLADLIEQIANGDFGIFTDELSQRCMTTMKNAIDVTPGAIEWFRTNGKCNSNDPMVRSLSSFKEVDNCGHTGSSMSWTFAQFRDIYQLGWNTWVLNVLLGMGVGWDQVSFEAAWELKNEKCITYKLKNMNPTPDALNQFMETAIKYEWENVITVLLNKTSVPIQKIMEWTYYCDKRHKNGIYYLFREKWDELYPRKLDLTTIDFCEFIKYLWNQLPHTKPELHRQEKTSSPTISDIMEELTKYNTIRKVNNKDFHWIKPIANYHPYFFDKEMKEVGFLARILSEFKNSRD